MEETIKKILIWGDHNIYNEENKNYTEELKISKKFLKEINLYTNINDIFKKLEQIKFTPTILILSGYMYKEFIKKYINDYKKYNVVLETIIFTFKSDKYLEDNKDNPQLMINDNFFNNGGVVDTFSLVKDYIKGEKYTKRSRKIEAKEINEEEEEQNFAYEETSTINKLILPIFFTQFLNQSKPESNYSFLKYLQIQFFEYSEEIIQLMLPLLKFKALPNELLIKYLLRLYSLNSVFTNDMNRRLKSNSCFEFTPLLQILFESINYKSIKPYNEKNIYYGSFLSQNRLNYLFNHQTQNFPSVIIFTRKFITFSTSREEEISNLKEEKNKKFIKVLYEIENTKNNEELIYNINMKDYAYYNSSDNILVFPFSAFEIKEIETVKEEMGKTFYTIKLNYLGIYKNQILQKIGKKKINYLIDKNTNFYKELIKYNNSLQISQSLMDTLMSIMNNPLINENLLSNEKSEEISSKLYSKIVNSNEEKEEINKWLSPKFKNLDFELLYRLSNDGEDFNIFHKKCDGYNNNLIIIESTKGNKFGAFCSEKWESCNIKKNYCNDVFLFRLNFPYQIFKNKYNKESTVYKSKQLGPILSSDFCFNQNNMTQFISTGKGEYLNKKELIENCYDILIDVKEIEIFHVIGN
jgi:hypothetical protein